MGGFSRAAVGTWLNLGPSRTDTVCECRPGRPRLSLMSELAAVPVLAGPGLSGMRLALGLGLGLGLLTTIASGRSSLILNGQVPIVLPWDRSAGLLLIVDPLVTENLLLGIQLVVSELAQAGIMGIRTEPQAPGKALVLWIVLAPRVRRCHRFRRRGWRSLG